MCISLLNDLNCSMTKNFFLNYPIASPHAVPITTTHIFKSRCLREDAYIYTDHIILKATGYMLSTFAPTITIAIHSLLLQRKRNSEFKSEFINDSQKRTFVSFSTGTNFKSFDAYISYISIHSSVDNWSLFNISSSYNRKLTSYGRNCSIAYNKHSRYQ